MIRTSERRRRRRRLQIQMTLDTTDKRVCGVFHPVWCFLWCFSPEVQITTNTCGDLCGDFTKVQITTSICGGLFKVGSKVGGHYENIKNMFDSMCTLYLECFCKEYRNIFRPRKCKPKFFSKSESPQVTTWNWPTSTVHNRRVPVKPPRIPYSPHIYLLYS